VYDLLVVVEHTSGGCLRPGGGAGSLLVNGLHVHHIKVMHIGRCLLILLNARVDRLHGVQFLLHHLRCHLSGGCCGAGLAFVARLALGRLRFLGNPLSGWRCPRRCVHKLRFGCHHDLLGFLLWEDVATRVAKDGGQDE